MVYYPCPGLEQYAVGTNGPVRGLFQQNARAYAAIGDHVWEIFDDNVIVDRGFIGNDNLTVTFSSNGDGGHQLFITSALNGYILDLNTNTLTLIAALSFPTGRALMGLYSDGYFIVLVKDSAQFQISALNDGLTWSGLDVQQRSDTADHLRAIVVLRRELWLIGEQTIEVWYDSGAPSFPFQPFPGKVMNIGCDASFSVVVIDSDQILFVGSRSPHGGGKIYRCQDSPERISTHYVERMMQSYPTTSDAVAHSYEEQGHVFYVVTFPTANATWVYDVLTGLWHERGQWLPDAGDFGPVRARYHTFAFEKQLVGDGVTGTLYRQSVYITTDDGAPIVRIRRAPHVAEELKWIFYQSAILDLETGLALATGQGSNPQVMLRWSDDGGHTWQPYITATAGLIGQYRMRAQWQRLGRSRDRVFEVRCSDPIPWRLLDFYMQLVGGTS